MRWLTNLAAASLLLTSVGSGCAAKNKTTLETLLPEETVDLGDVKPRPVLEAGAQHLDPTVRATALGWLVALDAAPGGGDWGTRALYDPSAWVQRAGVRALTSRLPEAESQSMLEEFVGLSQADPYVRSWVGIRLAEVGSEPAAEAMAAAWRAESEHWLVAPIALAAAAHGDKDALDAVATAVSSGEIGLELDFIRDLGASGHPELLPALQEGAKWVEDELALPFAVAQVQLGDPSGEQVLRRALGHADPEVRLGVLDLLVDLDHPTATALLQRAKSDDTELVRWYARLALAARTGSDPDVFDKAWADSDREVRALAVRLSAVALQHPVAGSNRKIGRAAGHVVREGLADEEATVRLQAVRAIGALRYSDVADHVAALLLDSWEQLRVEAAGATLTLGPPPT